MEEPDLTEPPHATGSSESQLTLSDEEGGWEDEPDINLAYPHEKSPSPPSSQRVALVRRRKGGKTVFVAQPNNNRRSQASHGNDRTNVENGTRFLVDVDSAQLRGMFNDGASFTLQYVFDIARTALHLLRKPLALLLFVYLLSLVLAQLGNTFRSVLSPLCWIPGISRTPLCYVPSHAPKVTKWADYPNLVQVQGSRFEQLLDESVGNSGIGLDIKRAEMATSDLITLVRVSDFRSRDALARHLEGFVSDAKKTGRGLQKMSSRIAGAVDKWVFNLDPIRAFVHDPHSP